MINSLTGILTQKSSESFCLQQGGIEWEILASLETLGKLNLSRESQRIYIYLHHKEDVLCLYGFATIEERKLFFDLLKVNGIGPKAALKILSGMNPDQFIATLEAEDVTALSKIPGLGKKTAQKIILALRGKLSAVEVTIPGGSTESSSELVESLVNMGYDKKSVVSALSEAQKSKELESLGSAEKEAELFRLAIIALSTKG